LGVHTWLYSVYTNIYKENRPICDAHAHLVVHVGGVVFCFCFFCLH